MHTDAVIGFLISMMFSPRWIGPAGKQAMASSVYQSRGSRAIFWPLIVTSDISASSSPIRASATSISDRNRIRRLSLCSAFSGGRAQG